MIDNMRKSFAILSLEMNEHPHTAAQRTALIQWLIKHGLKKQAARFGNGNVTDFTPIVKEIESEQRKWVAEDSKKRKFGPQSPITGAFQ